MYSIIIPCYKSANTIQTVVENTMEEMHKMNRDDLEFVLINDCSPDDGATINILKKLAGQYNCVKVLDLAKNAGQHNAMLAGLRAAKGDIFVSMDDDMQTRPSELCKMFAAFDNGYDVVYGAYPEKKENLFRKLGSRINKLCAIIFLGCPKGLQTSSFWIISKYVRDSIITYRGSHSYLLGLILRSTSNITQVKVQHFERECGKSGYSFRKLIKLWSNLIGFTVKPLRLAMQSGILISGLSFLTVLYIFIKKFLNPDLTAGWASIIIAIFFSLGIQLFFIGLIGEYIGRTYMHINNEPQYVIKAQYNINVIEKEEKPKTT